MAHIYGYDFEQEVVGESHYFEQLAKAFGAGKINKNGKRSYVVVRLVLENDNKYDKNAVAVVSNFGTVGYLRRADAKLYREIYGNAETHTTDAVIITRDGTKFGVWLDITLDSECVFDDYGDEFLRNGETLSKPNHADTPTQRPIILEPPQAPPSAKEWKDQSVGEKVATTLALAFLFGVLYIIYCVIIWLFRLIF